MLGQGSEAEEGHGTRENGSTEAERGREGERERGREGVREREIMIYLQCLWKTVTRFWSVFFFLFYSMPYNLWRETCG